MKKPMKKLLFLDIFLLPCAWLFIAGCFGSREFVYDYVFFNNLWFAWMLPVTFAQCFFLPYILGVLFIVCIVIDLIRRHRQNLPVRNDILRFCGLLFLYIMEAIALPYAFAAMMSV